MSKRIFIIGQCTLHWGRMEFGNIGNYYIARPMFQQLRRIFPTDEIVTTMQFSDSFCEEFAIKTVPMELYYNFESNDNLQLARAEYLSVCNGSETASKYIKEIKKADLVIDFSGDIWGKNADFLGKDRFLTGCYKDLTASKLTKTAMLAGSPGPFQADTIAIAKMAYAAFDFVSNREPVSTLLLTEAGFDMSKTFDFTCPSFLFEKANDSDIADLIDELQKKENRLKIGFILCGWNFKKGPFDLWPREDKEYNNFTQLIRHVINKYDATIYLLSHSNGFDIPPKPFVLKHGRDFPIISQLKEILTAEGFSNDKVKLLDGVYTPAQTKAIISHFDILISGRMHGAVAGLSQYIPTLIMDYGHEPKAHKLRGFAKVIDEDIITDPNDFDEMITKTNEIIEQKEFVRNNLTNKIPGIMTSARKQFDKLKNLLE